jgi:hypothetical protein
MPYASASDPKLPAHVKRLPAKKRRQWVAVWNRVHKETSDEGKAFAAANAAVKDAREYASAATIRRRVYARYALDRVDIDAIAKEVAALRVVAYEDRLRELARSAGIQAAPKLTDTQVLKRISRESRDVAAGIVRTHNEHLRGFVQAQERGLSQRELAGRVRGMLDERAAWKRRDIAHTESMAGRNAAAVDVLRMNGARVRVRAEPRSSDEPQCAAIVARGWYELADAPALPLHPNCVHSWALDTRFAAVVKQRERLWLGDWLEPDVEAA